MKQVSKRKMMLMKMPPPPPRVKKWVYTEAGPRECLACWIPEHEVWSIKIGCFYDALPKHAVFDTAEDAAEAARNGTIKVGGST